MIKNIFLGVLLMYAPLSGYCQQQKTEVFIIGTLHGAHKINPNYSYDSLFAFIESYNPDIIGVEIRAEDIDSSAAYLSRNYPFEMYECIKRYPGKKVLGFDWLGSDIENKAIPGNYWKEISKVKEAERKLNQDSSMLSKLSILNYVEDEKSKIALNASIRQLNDGRYDALNFIYYRQLNDLLKNTEYAVLPEFYQQRDIHIAQNILNIIRDNKGKKVIFLLGSDHRDYTIKTVSRELGNQIVLNH